MLAAAQRLRRRGEFAATIRAGRRAGRGAVVVHIAGTPAGANGYPTAASAHLREPMTMDSTPARAGSVTLPARAGFVVSKAVGGAVTRNTVKRRLRALMRERLAGLPAGTDVVVRAQPSAATTPYPRLAEDLDAALAAALRHRRSGGRGGEDRRG